MQHSTFRTITIAGAIFGALLTITSVIIAQGTSSKITIGIIGTLAIIRILVLIPSRNTYRAPRRIAYLLYNFMEWIDRKRGSIERYDYESAPYCGHHYSGHNGKLTQSSYHEGDGECFGEVTLLWKFKLIAGNHTEDGWYWYITRKKS